MTALAFVIPVIPVLLLAIWFGLFMHRVGLKNLRRELKSRMDERGGYDENGNHIYYDRKYIRYQQQKQKAAASPK